MERNLYYPIVATLLLTCHFPSFARSSENIQHAASQSFLNSSGNWFITLGAGAQFPDLHSNMNTENGSRFPPSSNNDRYSISDNNGAVIAASAGRRWQNTHFWFPSYSLGVFWQYFFQTNIHGKITQYSLPEFANYNYKIDIASNIVLASGKINLFKYGLFSPYVNGGLGSSFNNVSNFRETVLPGETPRVSPGFRNANSSEFAYNVGLGIDLQFMSQLIFSVGYIYQNLGPVSTGIGVNTWSSQSLSPGTYQSNEVLVTATYIFDREKKVLK
jgi:opacity protein-like surface antigen